MNLQILAITTDNASNNNMLIDELGDLLEGFQGSLTRVRCFAHILNLVVKVGVVPFIYIFLVLTLSRKSILSQFSQKTKVSEDTTEEAEDTAALDSLDEDLDEDATGNGEKEHVEGDDIDLSVEDSDTALVDVVAAEADGDLDVPTLSRDEVNLEKFTVTKVSVFCHNS
jgi:hypothetical protein